jgi:hypothetical protein
MKSKHKIVPSEVEKARMPVAIEPITTAIFIHFTNVLSLANNNFGSI